MVAALKPAFAYEVAFTPGVAICTQGPADEVLRWMMKPDSFPELSCQFRLIWVAETPEAARLDGAAGKVVILA